MQPANQNQYITYRLTKGSVVSLSVTNDVIADQRVHKMARTLSLSGARVVIVGKKSIHRILQPEYAQVIRFSLFFKKGMGFYAEYNIRLFFYLLFSKSTLFWANDLDTLPANALVSFLRRKPLVYDSHEYFTQSPEILHKPLVRKIWAWFEKVCVKNTNLRITVSPSIAKAYQAMYHKDFFVVRNVPELRRVITDTQLPLFMNHDRIILYQGSLNLGRGLEMAIEAMKYLEDFILVIIGGGDLEVKLQEMVGKMQLQDKVYFTGRLAHGVLANYTQKAFLGLSVEENMGKNYEYALPNKIFDYIHAQLPMVVSDLPEMASVVKQFNVGRVLQSREPEQFSALIKEMEKNTVEYDVFRKNCALAAQELCWEKETEKIRKHFSLKDYPGMAIM